MRRADLPAYTVVVSPRCWQRLENVPADTLTRIEHGLSGIAKQLTEEAPAVAQRPSAASLSVDGYIAVYDVDDERRWVILSLVMRAPEILSP